MNSFKQALSIAVFLIFGLAAGSAALGQEHPEEHPTEGEKSAAGAVTKEVMAEAIKSYIQNDVTMKGGYFLVYDAKANTPLALTLEKVHRDRLSKVSEGLYFACTDFKASDGKMYDLDFFMKATDKGLQVSEIMIHKEAGTPRYGWVEEGGVWKRK